MLKKAFIFLFLFVLSVQTVDAKSVNLFAYSRKAPETPIYTPYGQAHSLKDFAGDFLIIVFWSKTCIPCIRELDNLDAFVNKTRGENIKVILVSPEKDWITPEEQKNFLNRYGADDVEFFVDRDAQLAGQFGIFTSPHTVLIDRQSMEIGRINGAIEWDDDDVIEEIYRIKAINS